MSKTSKIVLGVIGLFVVVAALGASGGSKKDSTPSSTSTTAPSVTLVPNVKSSSSSAECSSMLSQYTSLNQQASSIIDSITPSDAASLASEIHSLVVEDVAAGRRLIADCPQYSYLNSAIDQLEATL